MTAPYRSVIVLMVLLVTRTSVGATEQPILRLGKLMAPISPVLGDWAWIPPGGLPGGCSGQYHGAEAMRSGNLHQVLAIVNVIK